MQPLPPLTVIRGVKGAFYVMAKVITIPGGSFGKGGEGHLRISFGGELDVINEAFDRIEQWLDNTGYPMPSAQ